MRKKLLAAALAFCMMFGSAAALPSGFLTDSTGITASADNSNGFNYTVLADGTVKITGIDSTLASATTLTVPAKLANKTVSSIGSGAFMMRSKLTSVTIANGITEIASSAFMDCTGLKTVSIPASVTTIGASAFKNCTALTSVTLPKNLSTLGTGAFTGCKALTAINIDSSNTSFASVSGVLYNKAKTTLLAVPPAVTSITIPGTLTTIPAFNASGATFRNLSKLTTVVLSEGTTKIGERAFLDCPLLTSVTIPQSVTSIGSQIVGYHKEDNITYTKVSGYSNITVKGYTSSPAHTYANNNGLKFQSIGSHTHTWGSPTYTWSSDGKTCTAKRVCTGDSSHVETANATITSKVKTAATCTTKGTTTYTATFSNSAFTTQTKDVQDIAINSSAHSWNTPTYTWSADGKTCTAKRVCKNNSSHTETATATITSKVKTAATCTTKGTTTYTATFSNSAFTTQTKDVEDIAAKGHSWNTPTYTWSADGKTCTAKRVCKNNSSHTETATATITSKVKTAATCTTKGTTTYTATFSNSAFTTQTKDVQDIAAKGHTWSLTKWTWSGYTSATATFTCSVCKTTQTASGNSTLTSSTPPTTSAEGKNVYTVKVSFNGKSYSDQKTETVPKITVSHTHTWGSPTYVWSADGKSCTATRICTTGSSHKEVETVTAVGKVKTAATCTAKGTTTYTATFSNSAFATKTKDVQDIPAKGHTWGAWTVTKAATCAAAGSQTRKCSVCNQSETQTIAKKTLTTVRASGKTRYETAANIADQVKTKGTVNTVILVNADKFADALAGVPYASQLNAPILLASKDELPGSTLDEIKKLGVKNIIILGGNSAVGKEAVEDKLKSQGYTVTRIKGSTRYETATNIAEKVNSKPTEVFIVYSQKFPDALAISSIAAQKKAPILYVDKTGTIDSYTKAYLTKHKSTITKAYVIGGKGAVSDDVKSQVDKTLGITSVRIKGSTRYETCLAVLKYSAFKSYVSGQAVCVTTGEKFPDALAGGILAAKTKAPVLLVGATLDSSQQSYLSSKKNDLTGATNFLYILGGKSSVPEAIKGSIYKKLTT